LEQAVYQNVGVFYYRGCQMSDVKNLTSDFDQRPATTNHWPLATGHRPLASSLWHWTPYHV